MRYKRDSAGCLQEVKENDSNKESRCLSCVVLQVITQFTQKRAGFGELKAVLRDKLKEIQTS